MFDTSEQRWRAVESRSQAATSSFVYAVLTTRIYCRPTCHARLARRANVGFYDTAVEAAEAGFRACKRCKPEQQLAESEEQAQERAAKKARTIIENSAGTMTLKDVAKEVGLSPRYFHGAFKNAVGVTPGMYAKRVRQNVFEQNSQRPDASIRFAQVNSAATQVNFTGANVEVSTSMSPMAPSAMESPRLDLRLDFSEDFDLQNHQDRDFTFETSGLDYDSPATQTHSWPSLTEPSATTTPMDTTASDRSTLGSSVGSRSYSMPLQYDMGAESIDWSTCTSEASLPNKYMFHSYDDALVASIDDAAITDWLLSRQTFDLMSQHELPIQAS